MELDPNKYKYVVGSLKASINNHNESKSVYEICNELSVAYHIPIAATLLICQKYILNNNEFEDQIKQLTKFYNYDTIIELED